MEMRSKRSDLKRKVYVISSSEDEDSEDYMPKKKPLQSQNSKTDGTMLNNNIDVHDKHVKLMENAKKLQALVEKKKDKTRRVNAKPKTQSSKISKTTIPKIPKLPKKEIKEEKPDLNELKVESKLKFDLNLMIQSNNNSIKSEPKEKLSNLEKKAKIGPLWKEHDIIASEHKLTSHVAKNIFNLFQEGNTIPFIARYRKEATGQMTPDELRAVKATYENTLDLKQKITNAYSKIEEMGKMNDKIAKSLLDARSFDTFDEIYAPYKPVNGEASIKRQMHAALDTAANLILDGKSCNLLDYVGKAQGLDSIAIVQKQIIPAIAKKLATSPPTLQFLQKMAKELNCKLETKKINKRSTKTETNSKYSAKQKPNKDESNFIDYYDRQFNTNQLKAHQILAINRAEHLKFIHVNLIFRDFSQDFNSEIRKNWNSASYGPMKSIYLAAVNECYAHIVVPLLKRMKRTELKNYAEKASLEIFSGNLKQILLAAPVKGKKILGVDPGFAHGCKLAIISDTGSLLATSVVYPHSGNDRATQEKKFRDILVDHNCSLIALGNGKACRETETWITDMINQGLFHPLEVSYTIVNESGASVYSCSKEAMKEFRKLDPNKISAVSLARRVQEPLAELVKIDPKHLGIGMYQHDVNQKRLEEALSDVVSECVSFVGIDINTASQCLLKFVAGLSDRRATEIIAYREEHGPFETREELLKVKGIGPHTFKQCAGFLKIMNGNNKLDSTIVHPESYEVAHKVIKDLKLPLVHIGDETFINKIKVEHSNLLNNVQVYNTSIENFETVLEGLSKPLNYDLRDDGSRKPLFRKGVTSMNVLEIGMILTGVVNNVTSFGCFVDIGVGTCGLIHNKNTKNLVLQIGDHVEVRVCNLEISRGRIGLELTQKL